MFKKQIRKMLGMHLPNDITMIGKILYVIGSIKIYKNGDDYSVVWRIWHPASWVMAAIVIFVCAFSNHSFQEEFRTKPSKYFQNYPEKLEWL